MALRKQGQISMLQEQRRKAKKSRGWDGVRFGGAAEMID
jgi:hypothetical protein